MTVEVAQSVHYDWALTGQPQKSCAPVSNWPISIHNWVYIFPSIVLLVRVWLQNIFLVLNKTSVTVVYNIMYVKRL